MCSVQKLNRGQMSLSVAKMECLRQGVYWDAAEMHRMGTIMCFLKIKVRKPVLLGPPGKSTNLKTNTSSP